MEKELERYMVCEVKKLRGVALKFISPTMAGVPDRIVLLPCGKIYFVELKSKNKKARPLQLAVHKIFKSLGQIVLVFDDKEKVRRWLDEIYPT